MTYIINFNFNSQNILCQVMSSSKKSTADITFSQALEELDKISTLMQAQDIEIEDISKYYERAIFLRKICLDKISKTELEIENIEKQFTSQE